MTPVKVHPHRTLVNAGETACVSVTPDRRHGRPYYMGTVHLRNVRFRVHQSGVARARAEKQRNVHAWAVGELMFELPEQIQPSPKLLPYLRKVTYHYEIGRFITVDDGTDVTDGEFATALFVGRDFYVSEF